MSDDGDPGAGLTPVPAEMLEALRAAYAVWNEGGPAAMVGTVWHPDLIYHYAPDFPEQGEIHGAAAAAAHFAGTWLEAFGLGVMTPVAAWWVHEGEVVLIELTLHQTGQSSGLEIDAPYFQLVRLNSDRQAIECWDYSTREQALEGVRGLALPQ